MVDDSASAEGERDFALREGKFVRLFLFLPGWESRRDSGQGAIEDTPFFLKCTITTTYEVRVQ